jgi:hypothetical protein
MPYPSAYASPRQNKRVASAFRGTLWSQGLAQVRALSFGLELCGLWGRFRGGRLSRGTPCGTLVLTALAADFREELRAAFASDGVTALLSDLLVEVGPIPFSYRFAALSACLTRQLRVRGESASPIMCL